jgi:hypothetical protein
MYSYKSTSTQIKGTVVSSGTNVATLDTNAAATTDLYNGWTLTILNGTGAGQIRVIIDYTDARLTTVNEDWTTAPDGTSEYALNEAQFIIDDVNGVKNLIVPSSTTDPVTAYVPAGSLRFNTTGDELEVGKNDNTWSSIGGGGGGGGLPANFVKGLILTYNSTSTIDITAGTIVVNGTTVTYGGGTGISHGSPGNSATLRGDVINFSINSSGTIVAEGYDTVTPPTYSDTLFGWYWSGTRRFIGSVMIAHSSQTIVSFAYSGTGNNLLYIKKDASAAEDNRIYDTSTFAFQHNTFSAIHRLACPVSTTAVHISIYLSDNSSTAGLWGIGIGGKTVGNGELSSVNSAEGYSLLMIDDHTSGSAGKIRGTGKLILTPADTQQIRYYARSTDGAAYVTQSTNLVGLEFER